MVGDGGSGAVDYRTACLRLPQFPLQLLLRQNPDWQGKRVVWLPELKAEARVRYLSAEAAAAGVQPGARYATVLGTVPGLLAGTTTEEEIREADLEVQEILRRFSPELRRRSAEIQSGLYLLDARGLTLAFGGMNRWARELWRVLAESGWEGRLALGFTAFATEMATGLLSKEHPIRLFQSRSQEERATLNTPLTVFSLNPEQVGRLARFEVHTLGDLLMLEPEEVKRRFGGELLEFYSKAVDAVFCVFPLLPELESMTAEFGFVEAVAELEPLLTTVRRLLAELLTRLISLEQAVSTVHVRFLTENDECHSQCLRPTAPTADLNWLMKLIRLRLERYFRSRPLRWGARVERVKVEVQGEPDPEKQGELFSDWALEVSSEGEERLVPRDKQAALWALSQVRAEFGEGCLTRAHLLNHHLPEQDHTWRVEREAPSWLSRWAKGKPQKAKGSESKLEGPNLPIAEPPGLDVRVRRSVYGSVEWQRGEEWSEVHGPYFVSGGWWRDEYAREYYFAQKEEQTAWLYRDLESGSWRVQGWLQ